MQPMSDNPSCRSYVDQWLSPTQSFPFPLKEPSGGAVDLVPAYLVPASWWYSEKDKECHVDFGYMKTDPCLAYDKDGACVQRVANCLHEVKGID